MALPSASQRSPGIFADLDGYPCIFKYSEVNCLCGMISLYLVALLMAPKMLCWNPTLTPHRSLFRFMVYVFNKLRTTPMVVACNMVVEMEVFFWYTPPHPLHSAFYIETSHDAFPPRDLVYDIHFFSSA